MNVSTLIGFDVSFLREAVRRGHFARNLGTPNEVHMLEHIDATRVASEVDEGQLARFIGDLPYHVFGNRKTLVSPQGLGLVVATKISRLTNLDLVELTNLDCGCELVNPIDEKVINGHQCVFVDAVLHRGFNLAASMNTVEINGGTLNHAVVLVDASSNGRLGRGCRVHSLARRSLRAWTRFNCPHCRQATLAKSRA
jgi:hypothetical protein